MASQGLIGVNFPVLRRRACSKGSDLLQAVLDGIFFSKAKLEERPAICLYLCLHGDAYQLSRFFVIGDSAAGCCGHFRPQPLRCECGHDCLIVGSGPEWLVSRQWVYWGIYVEGSFFSFEGSEFGENGLIRLAAHGSALQPLVFPCARGELSKQFAACFLGGWLGGLGFSGLGWYLGQGPGSAAVLAKTSIEVRTASSVIFSTVSTTFFLSISYFGHLVSTPLLLAWRRS